MGHSVYILENKGEVGPPVYMYVLEIQGEGGHSVYPGEPGRSGIPFICICNGKQERSGTACMYNIYPGEAGRSEKR